MDSLTQKYRSILIENSTGREVLSDILTSFCNFGCFLDPGDDKMVGEYNVGISILSRLGIFNGETKPEDVILALSRVTPAFENKPEESLEQGL
jgi:hypothetical protein